MMTNKEIIEKKCTECKWYGTISCECPLPCNCETKEYWSKVDFNGVKTELEPCEDNVYPLDMTTEQYRLRMIRAFHHADCDNLIALVVLPTEKEFEHLEWLLKTHYKTEPCEDCVSREQALEVIDTWDKFGYTETGCLVRNPKGDYVPYVHYDDMVKCIKNLPSVKPHQKTGHWILDETDNSITCNRCGCLIWANDITNGEAYYCPNCGAEMEDTYDD